MQDRKKINSIILKKMRNHLEPNLLQTNNSHQKFLQVLVSTQENFI